MFQMKVVEEIKFTFYVTYFILENCAPFEIIWITKVEADGPQMTI